MDEPTRYFTADEFDQLIEMAGLIEADAPSTQSVVARLRDICRMDQRQRDALQRVLKECGGGGFYAEPEMIADEVIAHLRGNCHGKKAERTLQRASRIATLWQRAETHEKKAVQLQADIDQFMNHVREKVGLSELTHDDLGDLHALVKHHEQEALKAKKELLEIL